MSLNAIIGASISSAVYELTQAERLPSDCQEDLREPLASPNYFDRMHDRFKSVSGALFYPASYQHIASKSSYLAKRQQTGRLSISIVIDHSTWGTERHWTPVSEDDSFFVSLVHSFETVHRVSKHFFEENLTPSMAHNPNQFKRGPDGPWLLVELHFLSEQHAFGLVLLTYHNAGQGHIHIYTWLVSRHTT
ncbi:uncharacterized protein EAF02_006139 [Botrytis sinoallii]|uniref:uncharacterized protein n=1 Tax=Botrytis sinoallii TaxID=1463999 RepID=UPI0018FF8E2C|nr:uncharacterized protein EAF02_006139 [Botrytis sinoallii]KAF7882776.1 hypothetical protein EAF02_006139 [Botrytis sinoallii]